MTEIKANTSNISQIKISDDVISSIIAASAMEVDGVLGFSHNNRSDFSDMLKKKTFSRGIKVSVNDKRVSAELFLVVSFGTKIMDISAQVQEKVKTAIETMTGLTIHHININIAGVYAKKTTAK